MDRPAQESSRVSLGSDRVLVPIALLRSVTLVAINTSKLLMQSRIGDEAELKRADIPVLQALPGVGRNLHDLY